MKTERVDRKKRYHEMLNSSRNCVADELVMTASHNSFKDMSREQIKEWADTCMEFVYNDLGYKKEQILHATVHLDEETPHIHCVVVPLIKKLDNRTKTERYTISKKQYIKDKLQLSRLQDMYHKRLTEKGYDLERGIKGSDNQHIKIKEYKKLNQELNVRNDRIDKVITNFAKYKNLLFISAKYMELSLLEKQKFLVEILFNIFQYGFKNDEINTKINQKLNVYDYCYSLNVL